MKQIDATAQITFTVESNENLRSEFVMRREIAEVLAAALDKYLSDSEIEGLEMHFLTIDDLSIEDYSED